MSPGVVPLLLACLGCDLPQIRYDIRTALAPQVEALSPLPEVGHCPRLPLPDVLETLLWHQRAPDVVSWEEPPSRDYLVGRFDPATDPRFVAVPPAYRTQPAPLYLREETWRAFQAMAEAARADGIRLRIVSGTRTFQQQRVRWEAVWRGHRAINGAILDPALPAADKARYLLQWIAMPTTSRHHWGTDLDINSVEPAYFEGGAGRAVHAWLQQHAASFGFCQPYDNKGRGRDSGYEDEPWHWSYVPLARALLRAYRRQVALTDVRDFAGAETAVSLDVFTHHVDSIASRCR